MSSREIERWDFLRCRRPVIAGFMFASAGVECRFRARHEARMQNAELGPRLAVRGARAGPRNHMLVVLGNSSALRQIELGLATLSPEKRVRSRRRGPITEFTGNTSLSVSASAVGNREQLRDCRFPRKGLPRPAPQARPALLLHDSGTQRQSRMSRGCLRHLAEHGQAVIP